MKIDDDDAPPTVSVLDARSVVEDDTELLFTVQLSAPSGRDVHAQWATSDVTAEAGTDYGGGDGLVVITPGRTSATIRVPVFEDECREVAEMLAVEVLSLTANPVAAGSARARISDDGDPEPC